MTKTALGKLSRGDTTSITQPMKGVQWETESLVKAERQWGSYRR